MKARRLSQLRQGYGIDDLEAIQWAPDDGHTPPMIQVERQTLTERKPEPRKHDPSQVALSFDDPP